MGDNGSVVDVMRLPERLEPDPTRLLLRSFLPGATNFGGGMDRLDKIVGRVADMSPERISEELRELRGRHGSAFIELDTTWLEHCQLAEATIPWLASANTDLRHLVGAYLTQTYAYEAAALTNPSIVPWGEPVDGIQPFMMSARAIGEGHISSIAFFSGLIDTNGHLELDGRDPRVTNGSREVPVYSKRDFTAKCVELGFLSPAMERILETLPDAFGTTDLDAALMHAWQIDLDESTLDDALRRLHWLAASNYRLRFDPALPVSAQVISPAAPAESRGMEDARFVRFVADDGSIVYYATYTAYDGARILPQLIETLDFKSFRIATMTGPAVHHKGMAIFPRKVGGDYVALSRHDQESSYVLRSDDIRNWSNAEFVLGPVHEWELVQTGNCGSPIETDEGWLVITHGVGPMRRYVLGAVLLDLDEPAKVLGRLEQPFIEPEGDQLTGYVPDVVYSCGSMVHGGNLVTPYGFSDYGIGFAVTSLKSMLAEMA